MDRPTVRLDQVSLVSGDVEASIAFYRRLGLDISDGQIWRTASGIHHVSAGRASAGGATAAGLDFDLGSAALARIWNTGWQGAADLRGRIVIGFALASREAVDETWADLTGAGYKGLQAPYDAFWGARYAVVEDPDGVAVGLMSPMSAAHRSAPPEV